MCIVLPYDHFDPTIESESLYLGTCNLKILVEGFIGNLTCSKFLISVNKSEK